MKHRRALVLAPILALTVVGASGASALAASVPESEAPVSEIASGLALAEGSEVPEPTLTETLCTVDPANLPPEGAVVLETVSEGGESATSYDTNDDGLVDVLLITVTDPETGEARFFALDRDLDGTPDYAYESSSNTCFDVTYPDVSEPTPSTEPTATPEPTPTATPTPTTTLSPAPATTSTPVATSAPSSTTTTLVYANCAAVETALGRQIRSGEPGYSPRLDNDNDGVGCENLPAIAPRTNAVPAGNTDGADVAGGDSSLALGLGALSLAAAGGATALLVRRRLAA